MMNRVKYLIYLTIFLVVSPAFAQKQIEYRSQQGFIRPEAADDITLVGDVVFKHEGMTMYCDSAIYNQKENFFFAYYNIVMVDKNGSKLFGDQLQYFGNEKLGYLTGREVILEDDDMTMQTDRLELDRNDNTVRYSTGANIWDKENTLTSREGVYYIDNKEFYFLYSVELTSPDGNMTTDTLIYNTKTEQANYYGRTIINTSDSVKVLSTGGSYNSKTEEIYSDHRAQITSKEQYLECDTIYYNKKDKQGYAYGNIYAEDTTRGMILLCDSVVLYTEDTISRATITGNIHCKQIDEGDTLFFHSDTILVVMDTSFNAKELQAFSHCKFFRDDMQGAAEYCLYVVEDSMLTMLSRPVLWSEQAQLTSDTIQLEITKKGAKQIFMYPNPMIVQNSDSLTALYFNQICGRDLVGWFENNNIKYAEIKGNAQVVYYLWEDKKKDNQRKLTGVNIGQSKQLNLYFSKGEVQKLSALNNPYYYIDAEENIPESDKRLKGFVWCDSDRPVQKTDIFIHRN